CSSDLDSKRLTTGVGDMRITYVGGDLPQITLNLWLRRQWDGGFGSSLEATLWRNPPTRFRHGASSGSVPPHLTSPQSTMQLSRTHRNLVRGCYQPPNRR